MNTLDVEHPPQPIPAEEPENYLNATTGVMSWLLTKDHKRIAILFLVSITVMFFIGGIAITIDRLNLMVPDGGLVSLDTYNRLFTAHGVIMLFFFLVPIIPSALANFVLPMMIGAKDMALPRLNLFSWYVYVFACLWELFALILGGVDTGWTFYTPYSSRSSHYSVTFALAGVVIVGFSSIFTALNIIVTTHKLRAPGLTWWRLPIFVWTLYATSFIIILAVPVLTTALLMIIIERFIHIGIFDPALGGDPVLFQHLFWFYGHPAVYVQILPAMGVVSELVTCFSRKNIYGYTAVALSTFGIAAVSFLVWAHHMFVAGISIYAAFVFSLLSYMVAVPSAIKVFNWTATMYKGSVSYEAPMLYALGFIALFTAGGMTGLFLAALGMDMHVHDTYFVVAHFHFIMVGGAVMAFMGGLHYWWPKITGRMYNQWWAKQAAILIFFGFFVTFLPQYLLGYAGMPRRYPRYNPGFQVWNVMSSAGASILGIGYVLPLFYLSYSLKYGPRAGPNPWQATGLEWQTPSPPPKSNFEKTPVVVRSPYSYPEQKAQNEL